MGRPGRRGSAGAASPAAAAAFGRVLTAMVTPFRADGALDLDGAQRLATHLVDHGHDGLVVSGTTGESPTTSDAEKDALVRAVVEAVGDRARVVAGAGTNDTHHTVELSPAGREGRRARAAAGHAVLQQAAAGGPGPALHRGRRRRRSAGDALRHPRPHRHADRARVLVRLAEHERIVAVKDAKGDLFEGSRVMAETGLAYYSGDDALNLLAGHGAVGVVSVVGHVPAREYAAMVAAVDAATWPPRSASTDGSSRRTTRSWTSPQGAIRPRRRCSCSA